MIIIKNATLDKININYKIWKIKINFQWWNKICSWIYHNRDSTTYFIDITGGLPKVGTACLLSPNELSNNQLVIERNTKFENLTHIVKKERKSMSGGAIAGIPVH